LLVHDQVADADTTIDSDGVVPDPDSDMTTTVNVPPLMGWVDSSCPSMVIE
jgi:hypothetical protein